MKTTALASAALLAALSLAGCAPGTGGGMMPPVSSEDGSTANAIDQMFVMMMIPHHEQAIEMADMVLAKDDIDARVVELSQQIKNAQGPEIETMKNWLEDWGMPYVHSMMDGMDHGSGMMSEGDMAALEAATGDEASRLFLAQMIEHHEGAIDMAQPVIDGGEHPGVTALAQAIVESQSAEIETMRKILDSLQAGEDK